jgi:hypothetical protein
MSAKQVTHYRLAWNPKTNQGRAEIFFKKENQTVRLKIDSAQELAAVAAVLKESPVFLTGDGLIYTGWEEIDD